MHNVLVRLQRMLFDLLTFSLIAGIERNRLWRQALNALRRTNQTLTKHADRKVGTCHATPICFRSTC